ncbi:MAG TPA: M14 family zinc carboxypeptidase, partial [Actinomycetota bacterium]|nr:M14 family zinc carboxypeptidase [Actinomycetota bacterium]
VDRGNCTFAEKTANAQAAGAVAVVIVNNVPGAPTAPGGTALPGTTIPTVMVGQADGNAVKAGLPATGTVFGAVAANNASRVVLVSRAWGHEGGNDITAQFVNPGAANSPLAISVSGNAITVSLATNASGGLTSTAANVVAAINAHPGASALVKALTFQGNAGTGFAPATLRIGLSDFLSTSVSIPASGIPHGNEHVQRGPFQPKVMRIGKVRDGSKVGIYLFCQQHAREWVTPITCLETAERLLRNYSTDPLTKDLVDNLDVFILPSVNPDGAHYSFYNFQSQRKNMTNWCVNGAQAGDNPFAAEFWTPRINPGSATGAVYTQTDAGSRNVWGTDLNRNQTVGTIWDGYVGASHSCNSEVYAGPGEASDPEAKNEAWIVDTFDNIKFSNNIHTSGGYFMWAPGAYELDRTTLPAPNIGIEKYFFAASETVLGRIAEYRGNVVLPQRTGPIADVLYSAAGNSADDNYYRKGIIGYSFEAGSDVFVAPTLTVASAAGASGVRVSSTAGMAANDYITVGWNGTNPEIRRIQSISTAASPAPNVILQQPLEFAHAIGEQVNGGTAAQGVGFFPPYGTEGRHEANEFANGNFGLLEAALEYARDKEAPLVRMTGDRISSGDPIRTTFEYVNEPSVIHYTVDGSMPTFDSPKWDRQGLRRPGEVFEFSENTTVRWLALDLAGNTSRGVARFSIGEQYTFGGFRAPVLPGVNERTAGATVPVKFAIDGKSSPADVVDIYSESANCETGEAAWTGVGSPAESFSAVTVDRNGQYQVDWKTAKAWKGTCRALVLVLSDNTEHTALFRFR